MNDQPPAETMGLPGLLRAARGAYGQAVRKAFADAGFEDIPRNGAFVLARAYDNSAQLARLTRELGISKQAVSQLIDTLVMRGYLERVVDAEDRRRMVLTLTPRGEAAAEVSWRAASAVDEELASRLPAGGVAALRTGLAVLAEIGMRADAAEH
ncbi:MAG TPA: MarR family transcriptional regulator [Streptosporangiaceae bacterium]|nr:MarR family transcriptional regulator [Streptosporangiaceae bacterium]